MPAPGCGGGWALLQPVVTARTRVNAKMGRERGVFKSIFTTGTSKRLDTRTEIKRFKKQLRIQECFEEFLGEGIHSCRFRYWIRLVKPELQKMLHREAGGM
jgi:hypothetical protein